MLYIFYVVTVRHCLFILVDLYVIIFRIFIHFYCKHTFGYIYFALRQARKRFKLHFTNNQLYIVFYFSDKFLSRTHTYIYDVLKFTIRRVKEANKSVGFYAALNYFNIYGRI